MKIKGRFPNGAILKLADDHRTGDKGTLLFADSLISDFAKSNLSEILRIYEGREYVPRLLKMLSERATTLGSRRAASRVLNFIGDILDNPKRVLIQETVDIEKFAGQNLEFRVDFVNGTAISAAARYGYAYLPELNSKAIDFVDEFLYKIKGEYPDIAGGADVVVLKDGRMKLLELNLGPYSAYRFPTLSPTEANWFLTFLQGHPTPMIEKFFEISKLPVNKQIDFIYSFNKLKMRLATDVLRTYVVDIAASLRNIAIDKWLNKSTQFPSEESVLSYVDAISNYRGPSKSLIKDFAQLRLATRDYFNKIDRSARNLQEGIGTAGSQHSLAGE
jgi:hypothetical protein